MNVKIITGEIEQIDQYFQWQRKGRQHNLLIDAVAGSGKTTTLVCGHLAAIRNGNRVLALAYSFTGAAQYNTVLRPEAAKLGIALAEEQFCRTFESFAASCLAKNGTAIRAESGRLGDAIRINPLAMETMRQVVESLNMRYEIEDQALLPSHESDLVRYLEEISNIKINLVFHDRFAYLDDEEISDDTAADIDEFIEEHKLPAYAFSMLNAYENLREGRQFLRHGDAAYALVKDPKAIDAYLKAQNINLVLVDEFHDTKPVYFALLKQFQKAGCSIAAVGDEAQDIFAWKDLAPFSACEAFRQLEPVTVLPLSRTFRFGRPASIQIGRQRARADNKKIDISPAGHATGIRSFNGGDESIALEAIRAALDTPVESSEREKIAIILPHKQMANPLMRALCEAGIAYHTQRIHPLHTSLEVQICHAIALIYDWCAGVDNKQLDAMALMTFLDLPALNLDFQSLQELKQSLAVFRPNSDKVDSFITGRIPDLISSIRERINFERLPCSRANLERIWQMLSIAAWRAAKEPNSDEFNASWACLNAEGARLVQLGAQGYIAELYREFEFFSQSRQKPGVEIVSVLQSKGREWATVVLPHEWASRYGSRDKLHQKQLYVAMSRAKENLFLCNFPISGDMGNKP